MIRSPAQGQPRFPHENILRFSDEQAGLIAIVSIHRPLHGVAMGGTRLLPYGCEEDAVADALRLSEAMTLKAACAGLPVGGAKAVIIAAPAAKTEALLRSYARFIESLRGRFITGQDMNVTADDVRTMAQETRFIVGIGGASEGPAAMTARGVFAGLRGALRVRHGATSFAGVKVAIQGVGAVGARLAEFLVDQGAEVVVADLDQARAADVAARLGARVAPVALIHLEDVDIFAPCGRGGSISNQVIPLLKATIVGGAANNQLVDEAGGSFLLKRRGIAYCPDFVINAGGLIDVYNEHVGAPPATTLAMTEAIQATVEALLEAAASSDLSTYAAATELADARRNAMERGVSGLSGPAPSSPESGNPSRRSASWA